MLHIHRILTIIMMGITTSTVYGALKTSIVNFQGVPGNSIEASDGIIWTITTDAASVDYDESLGVCWHTVSYVRFTATEFRGKVLCLTINASGKGNPTLISGQTNSSNNQPITEDNKKYIFYSYYEPTAPNYSIDFEIYSGSSKSQRISIKSIEVIYDDEATPASHTIYEQVSDVNQLKNNDEIIIASQNSEKYRVLWGNYNGGVLYSAQLSRNDDGTFSDNPALSSCPILLEKAEDNLWYLRASEGYIYDESSIVNRYIGIANSLEAVGNDAKVSISFDDEGKATIKFPRHTATIYNYLFLKKINDYRYDYICDKTATPLCIFRKVKQEPATISVTFKEKFGGWTSLYYKDKNLVVPNDFTAYAYSVSNGEGSTSTPYETGDVIPKDTPVLLKLKEEYAEYDEDKTRTVTVAITNEEGEAADENALLGSEDGGATTVDGITEGFEFFRLTLNAKSEEDSIGFYWGADNGGSFTIGAHKAYLALPKPQSSTTSYIPLRILPYLLGDANGDGQVNVADIMVVINYIIDWK